MRNREKFADIVKGICIICVVFVHIDLSDKNSEILKILHIVISNFFLPTFFVISGFYLKNIDNIKSFFKNKIVKNYKKMLIYYIPFVLLHNFFIKMGFYGIDKIYGDKLMLVYSPVDILLKLLGVLLLMGREPLLGPLWFLITYIIAMIGLLITNVLIKKVIKTKNADAMMCLTLLILLCISGICTNVFNITIPRFSISLSVMILIYFGMLIKQKYKFKFDNVYIFFISILLFTSNCIFVNGISLNTNKYYNPVTFLVSSISSVYILCFIAKKIENLQIGKMLMICGKNSFEIMALHLLSFKLVTYFLNKFEIEQNITLSDLCPKISNIYIGILYIFVGVFLPILIKKIFNLIKLFKLKGVN